MRRAVLPTAWSCLAAGALAWTSSAWAQSEPGRFLDRNAPAVPTEAAPAPLNDARAYLEEMRIEMLWHADPATFLYEIEARCTGKVVDLVGVVPNEGTRQHALRIARQATSLGVRDSLRLQNSLPSRRASETAGDLEKAVVRHLFRGFGNVITGLEVRAKSSGQVTLLGTVPSYEDKRNVGRALRLLTGVTSVVNQLEVPALNHNGKAFTQITSDGQQLVALSSLVSEPIVEGGLRTERYPSEHTPSRSATQVTYAPSAYPPAETARRTAPLTKQDFLQPPPVLYPPLPPKQTEQPFLQKHRDLVGPNLKPSHDLLFPRGQRLPREGETIVLESRDRKGFPPDLQTAPSFSERMLTKQTTAPEALHPPRKADGSDIPATPWQGQLPQSIVNPEVLNKLKPGQELCAPTRPGEAGKPNPPTAPGPFPPAHVTRSVPTHPSIPADYRDKGYEPEQGIVRTGSIQLPTEAPANASPAVSLGLLKQRIGQAVTPIAKVGEVTFRSATELDVTLHISDESQLELLKKKFYDMPELIAFTVHVTLHVQ